MMPPTPMSTSWPTTADALEREQVRLAACPVGPWAPPRGPMRLGACAAVYGRAGREEARRIARELRARTARAVKT